MDLSPDPKANPDPNRSPSPSPSRNPNPNPNPKEHLSEYGPSLEHGAEGGAMILDGLEPRP